MDKISQPDAANVAAIEILEKLSIPLPDQQQIDAAEILAKALIHSHPSIQALHQLHAKKALVTDVLRWYNKAEKRAACSDS